MENYIVRKLITGTVFYIVPGEGKERVWKGTDARVRIPFDELEKCIYDADVRELFERGYLYIEDKDCRIKLGLEDPDPTLAVDTKLVLDKKEIATLLYESDLKTFMEKVVKLAEGSIELMLETAVNTLRQLSVEKADYIRKTYHIDVERIQRDKRDEEANTTKEG